MDRILPPILSMLIVLVVACCIIHWLRREAEDFASATTEADNANASWREVLMYIQANPADAGRFLAEVKSLFFGEGCAIVPTDLSKIGDKYRPVF